MKNNAICFYYLIVFIGLGCCKEQQPSTNQSPEALWKTSFGNGLTSSINPVIYKNIVVYSAYDSSNLKSKLIAFNKETGVKVWEWKNNNNPQGFFPPKGRYIKDNILVILMEGRPNQVAAINLENGTPLWHTILPEGGDFQITGINNKVFSIRSSSSMKQEIFVSDIRTGDWQLVYTALNVNAPLYIRGMHTYQDINGKSHLAFLVVKEKDLTYTESTSTLFKYSLDSNKIMYEKVLSFLPKRASPFLAAATSEKFWLEDSPAYALNEATGDKILEIMPPLPEVLSGKIGVWGDKIFMPRTETLICYDGKTGKPLWVDDGTSSGSTDRFQVHNDVVYFASRGDGHLHAFDIQTGKHLWKVESPDKKQDSAGFDAIVTVDTLSNKVYAATYLSAVCYKAAR